jgi:hypothetical protein
MSATRTAGRASPPADPTQTLGQAIDSVDALAHVLKLQELPDALHVERLRVALPEAVQKLKDAYVRLFNVNPWEDT